MSNGYEPMKVYELAKELGVDSLSLLDKLKKIDISVKSHMSSLDPKEVEKARSNFSTKLKSKSGTGAKKAKTKTKKRTSTARTAKKTKAVLKRRSAAGATTKTAPTATEAAAPAEVAPPESTSPQKTVIKRTAPVIRRRTENDGTTTSTEIRKKTLRGAKKKTSTPAGGTDAQEVKNEQDDSAPIEQTHEMTTVEIKKKPEKKKLLNFVQGGIQPEKRNSLQIVKPAEKKRPKPQGPGVTATDPSMVPDPNAPAGRTGRGKIIKMNKESLDRMALEEAAKKKGGGGAREPRRPEDVKFADYRKKEMVFLPKKKRIPPGKELRKTQITTPKASKRIIEVDGGITVGDLAGELGVKANEIIRKLIKLGNMVTINQFLDVETASVVASEYQYEVKNVEFKEEALIEKQEKETENEKDLKPRPPVVTVMGHVDHGKTSLLDAIKDTKVVQKEAGGITQHIGAYTVDVDDKQITFIDTPGHEAFTVMRARGANVTDIVVLVVAADDGVMPQTREAVNHAKEAGVPIIVAVNKMDKPGANPEKVKQGLAELDLLAEDWGGQTMYVPVSAIKQEGIKELLEAINLNAEILELKANPNRRAQGTVLESRLEKGKGPVVSVLVQRGTLHRGDSLVAGFSSGKVRALTNHLGQAVDQVLPGMAGEILGLDKTPEAGENFYCTKDEADAKRIIDNRRLQEEKENVSKTGKMSLDDLFSKIQNENLKELKIVVKADVFGSIEAIRDNLSKLSTDKVKVNVIHGAAGGITESDVLLASASKAIIIGFNVRPETKAMRTAESEGIEIKTYSIIYELFDDVKKAMSGLLEKKKVEKALGRAEVRQTFTVPKLGVIAGCAVVDGKIVRGAQVRLLRDSRIIFEGKMHSLKRFKDDAKEVASGYECGIGIEGFNDIKPGDLIEAYEIELVSQEL